MEVFLFNNLALWQTGPKGKKGFVIADPDIKVKLAKRNLFIMWFANFFIAGSMTMVIPFLSLYIETFGDFSKAYVQNWSGWVFAITFVTGFIAQPIWGRFGDKYGRKPFLVIAAFGLSASVFFMGSVQSVIGLFILRFFMGIFSGFISTSQALISTQTPKHIAGKVLGTLQTGNVTGSLIGPLFGGLLADTFNYSTTFHLTAFSLIIAGLLVIFGLKEYTLEETKVEEKKKNYSSKEVIILIMKHPMLLMTMIICMFVQVANFSIQPILSLYVAELHGAVNLAFFSGLAFSATGLGNLFMTRKWGSIADRFGYEKVMLFLIIASGIIYLPGAFVTEIWQLVILRFLLGMTIGGIVPVRTAYVRQEAPISIQGEVLGYSTSLRFLGNIIGPLIGGFISGLYGISSVFYFSSGLLIISGLILFASMHHQPKTKTVNHFH
jgi:MFS transporter, DHA1 family, multidrug resistance protein